MHILVKNFGINQLIGASILASICFIVLLGNINKIAKINSIIIPILIAFILFVGVQNLKTTNINALQLTSFTNNGFMWIIQATLYASYNLILLIPVLINLKKFIKNKKQILIVSIISSVILSIISILVFFLLINVNASFDTLEMPAVYVIKNKFNHVCDYSGCRYPEGIISSDRNSLFNHEDIEEIFYIGYTDDEQKELSSKLKK